MAHYDRHVVKMCLETAQILCTALHHHHGIEAPYKPTHKNHPCVLWAAESQSNFMWLAHLGLSLCDEYTFRYGKEHKCRDVILQCVEANRALPCKVLSPPPLCMPEVYHRADPVEAYRAYYMEGKAGLRKYTRREPPEWLASCGVDCYA